MWDNINLEQPLEDKLLNLDNKLFLFTIKRIFSGMVVVQFKFQNRSIG